MSRFAVVPTHWVRHAGLSPTDKAVLTALATYASEERYSYPSVKTISADLQLSTRTVQYALRALEELGAIKVERRRDEEGRDTSNGYWITGYDVMQGRVQPIAPTPVQSIAPTPVQPIAPKQYQYEQDQLEASTTPPAGALIFPHPDVQEAYEAYRGQVRNGRAFDATVRSVRDGMTTGKPVSMEVLGLAILEMAGNGELFNVSRLRGYIRKHEATAQREAASPAGDPLDPAIAEVRRQYPNMSLEMARAVVSLEAEYAAKEGVA